MKKKRPNFRKRPFSKGEISKDREKDKDKEQPTCFKCKKLDHFKVDCSLLKKSSKRMKKKAMIATWSDSEDSSSDEEAQKIVNLYLIAQEDEVTLDTQSKFSFEELQAFYDWIDELKKLTLKNKNLKSSIPTLIEEKEEILKEKESISAKKIRT